ncbi:hypothetical protein pb186bvf_009609 [Paramecium bursaria]
MSYFEQNETQFLQKMETVQKFFQQYPISSAKQNLLLEIKIALNQASQQLQFMTIESKHNSNSHQKSQLDSKLKKYNQDYKQANERYKDLQNNGNEVVQKQQQLFGEKPQDMKQVDKKAQLLGQTYQLQDTNKVAEETLDLTLQINAKLLEQKQLLLSALDKNQDIGSDINKVNKYANAMRNREAYSKIILVAIIAILTIGNAMLIFYKFW